MQPKAWAMAVGLAAFLSAVPAPAAGPLAAKADNYQAEYRNHHPGQGGLLDTYYADDARTQIKSFDGHGDSAVHTGAYLAAQAFRYAYWQQRAQADPQPEYEAERDRARLEVKSAAQAQHHLLEVTGVPGYLARYAGPCRLDGDSIFPTSDCQAGSSDKKSDDCHPRKYEGCDQEFWLGRTSRDQYDGWFYGYGVAYELVDDAPLRDMVRQDVQRVITTLDRHGFMVTGGGWLNALGGGNASYLPNFRLGWSLVADHVLGDPGARRRYEREAGWGPGVLRAQYRGAKLHNYNDYFAFMFYHRDLYFLARLDPDPARKANYLDAYEKIIRPLVQGTSNVFFDYTYLSLLPADRRDPEILAAARAALLQFPDPVNWKRCPALPLDYELDPCSVRLEKYLPCLDYESQAVHPFPIADRCSEDFLWQRSPYSICQGCEANPKFVRSGADYLLAYWMGRYYGFLTEND